MNNMAKQTQGEILLSNFRSNINKGDIYVLEEKNGKVVQLRKVKYFSKGEFDEINKIANENNQVYVLEQAKKEQEHKEYLANNFNDLKNEIENEKAKNYRLSVLLLKALKVLYGTSEEDFATLINDIEKEIGVNE